MSIQIRQRISRLQSCLTDKWDKQIKSDVEAGKLNTLIKDAEADIPAGIAIR